MSCATQAMRVWCCHMDHDCLMKDTGILSLTPNRSDDAGSRADLPLFVLSESPASQILWSCVVGKGFGSAVGRMGPWEEVHGGSGLGMEQQKDGSQAFPLMIVV